MKSVAHYLLPVVVASQLIGCGKSPSPPVNLNSYLFSPVGSDSLHLFCGGGRWGGETIHFYKPELWQFSGASWSRLSTCNDLPSGFNSVTFDPDLSRLFFVSRDHGGTWTWDGHAWTKRSSSVPPKMRDSRHHILFDTVNRRVELFDFNEGQGWFWGEDDWIEFNHHEVQPFLQGFTAYCNAVFDPVNKRLLFYGNIRYEGGLSVVEYKGKEWRVVAKVPDLSFLTGIVFDPERKKIILLGMNSGATGEMKVFELEGDKIASVESIEPPSARYDPCFTYDVNRAGIVMHGGWREWGIFIKKSLGEMWLLRYSEADNKYIWLRID